MASIEGVRGSQSDAAGGAGALRTLHLLLSMQTVLVILVALNRRTDLMTGYVSANEFLRWVDLINMLVLPVASLLVSVLLKRWLEARVPGVGGWRGTRGVLALDLTFMLGVYVLEDRLWLELPGQSMQFRFRFDEPAGRRSLPQWCGPSPAP